MGVCLLSWELPYRLMNLVMHLIQTIQLIPIQTQRIYYVPGVVYDTITPGLAALLNESPESK